MAAAAAAESASLNAAKTSVVAALPADPMAASLDRLRAQQALMRQQRKQLAQEVKNARKRVHRLKQRSRGMSDEDLVAVLMMRKEQAKSKASGETAGAEMAEPGAGPPAKKHAGRAARAAKSPSLAPGEGDARPEGDMVEDAA